MAGSNGTKVDTDVVVVGAGLAGLYLLHRLRSEGRAAIGLEAGTDVGGTWYWNRYPGARCDIPTTDYTFTWDPDFDGGWTWSERYATQPEILGYIQSVADKHDLRRDIRFETRVTEATWDGDANLWRITTDQGDEITARYYVMATGCLSAPKSPDVEGADRFAGEVYFTSRWPHAGVDFTGKRVGVIGTGSSGIQSIPLIAAEADTVTVFQRTPNFSIPARNGPVAPDRMADLVARRDEYRDAAKWSRGGVPNPVEERTAAQIDEAEKRVRLEEAWQAGELFAILGVFADQGVNEASNEIVAEFIRDKIRATVKDPVVAEKLCPTNHPFGTKRPCLDTNYYETFNLDHVELVDLLENPIVTITETGIQTRDKTFEFDAIVYATGFDAMTGAIVNVDITGRDGVSLKREWEDGPHTYLGLMVRGFPNFFMVTGPGSPSVLSNMAVSIEQHVEWITDCIDNLEAEGKSVIEPTETAQEGWDLHVGDTADITLYPKANSWYMGANVPGKPRVFLPYVGGVDAYRRICDEVVEQDYLGLERSGDGRVAVNDGVIRRVQPDVAMVLEMMAELDLPPIESMSPSEAREFMEAGNVERPPGPEVGEIFDGELPGPAGPLAFRGFRPVGDGPHPIVLYFHGGGWVLGNESSDEPFLRDLCDRSGALILSVDYRHAPEDRFPAAVDDGFAALQWVAAHATELGGDPDRLLVMGWSAGGNVAAVACQEARDRNGPAVAGQVLMTPVVDCDMSRPSYLNNAEGYVLTASLMRWFWDHYADPDDRTDPRASPLRAGNLSGLPPTVVVTAEFDPLSDEGAAYAEALAKAGTEVTHLPCRGHTHTSVTMVDVVLSGAPVRAQIAESIQRLVGTPVPA
ncbi:MAG: flavin-containing monooxygenase [Acidimicrobiales bacterium]